MATQTKVFTASHSGTHPYIELTLTEDTDIASNTSILSGSLVLKRPSTVNSSANKKWNVVIDGTTYSGSGSIGGSGDKTLLTISNVIIQHAGDGSKTIAVSADCTLTLNWSDGYLASTVIDSTNWVLTNIPRAGTISTSSNYTISSSSGYLSFVLTSKASFYYRVYWKIGSYERHSDLGKKDAGTYTYSSTISNSTLLNMLPSSVSGSVTLRLTTYTDSAYSNSVGESSVNANVLIDTSKTGLKPSIGSVSVTRNSNVSGISVLLTEYGTLTTKFNTTNSYGASKTTTVITVKNSSNGAIIYEKQYTTTGSLVTDISSVLPSYSSNYNYSLTLTAVDSRGISVSYGSALTGTVYLYTKPVITKTNLYRCTASGVADDLGTNVYFDYDAAFSQVNSAVGNTGTVICKYGSTTYAKGSHTTDNGLPLSTSRTYIIEASDKITTTPITVSVTIPMASFVLDLYESGNNKGVAIGSVAEANKFKIGLDVYGVTDTVAYKHQITTSFKNAVAMGSYGTAQTTLDGFVNEIKFSNGATGSFSLNTAYTRDGITIPTGWYNFIFSPHRTGGLNGGANGDNTNYGNLILMGMTGTRKIYKIRVSGGYVDEVLTSSTITDFSNAIAKGETKYTGKITWGSWVAAKTENELIRIGNVVQCRIRWKSAADTNTNSPQVGTIPNGFKPALQFYAQANVCWSNVQVPISINPTSGVMTHMNKVYAINTSYIITATWLTSDDYPS